MAATFTRVLFPTARTTGFHSGSVGEVVVVIGLGEGERWFVDERFGGVGGGGGESGGGGGVGERASFGHVAIGWSGKVWNGEEEGRRKKGALYGAATVRPAR